MSGKSMIGLGIMSGSSLDGIDAILVEIDLDHFRVIQKEDIPLSDVIKEGLRKSATLTVKDYLLLEADYSTYLSKEVNKRFESSYDFISVHGHTTHHFPEQLISNQLVNGGLLSALTKKKVITDFRMGDIALGGIGTPMIPIVERNLFNGFDYYLNLGGIANITIAQNWNAYDVCPCNQLLNYMANKLGKEFDAGGAMARSGTLDKELLSGLGDFPFYKRQAPKSIDNNWIKEVYFPLLNGIENTQDVLHTLTLWIANVIVDQLKQPGKLFVTGGGAHNNFLMESIKKDALKRGVETVVPSKEVVDFKEAILMAYLGFLRINLKTTMLCSVTGADKDSVGGAIYNVHGR